VVANLAAPVTENQANYVSQLPQEAEDLLNSMYGLLKPRVAIPLIQSAPLYKFAKLLPLYVPHLRTLLTPLSVPLINKQLVDYFIGKNYEIVQLKELEELDRLDVILVCMMQLFGKLHSLIMATDHDNVAAAEELDDAVRNMLPAIKMRDGNFYAYKGVVGFPMDGCPIYDCFVNALTGIMWLLLTLQSWQSKKSPPNVSSFDSLDLLAAR